MTTIEGYIAQVLDRIPRHLPLHDQVKQELRSLFAEHESRGQSFEEAAGQLGDPATLAESYLSAVPLVPAPFMARVEAKVLDAMMFTAVAIPLLLLPLALLRAGAPGLGRVFLIICLAFGSLFFWVASAWAETRFSRTPGKKLMGLYVARETGARISFGQAVVRQLPVFLQIFLIDALFALFTERHQRAFELLSRTRTVRES